MEYSNFFALHERLNGQNKIGVVKAELLVDFIRQLMSDEKIPLHFRTLVITCLSGGLRINEALSLKKDDFVFENGSVFVRVNVLKKRKKELRWAKIHPIATEFVWAAVSQTIGGVFKISQSGAFRRCVRFFGKGVCNHSFRHSIVSYMLFEQNMHHTAVAKLLHVGVAMIENYAHIDEKRVLSGLFK